MNWTAAARDRGLLPAQDAYTRPAGIHGEGVAAPSPVRDAMPSSVEAADWDRLSADVARVLCNEGIVEDGQLQHAVHVVVRAMRRGRASWDAIYLALASSLGPCDTPVAPTPRGMERHASRGAALIAHMHCWADCVRLEEIEHGA